MAFMGLSMADKNNLYYEVISKNARLKLTRLIREMVKSDDENIVIHRQNRLINIARNVLGLPIYVLEADDMGYFQSVEHSWHYGEIELSMRRPDTEKLVETLADLIEEKLLVYKSVNEILLEDGSSVQFSMSYDGENVKAQILPVDRIDEVKDTQEHPNIRKLISRMENNLRNGDLSAVLHASASVFETLAKDVVNSEAVQNETLGSFFGKYKKDSTLPEPILDYILDIYKRRNSEPLAGHGSLKTATIDMKEAIILVEMTKAFVRIERQLAIDELSH